MVARKLALTLSAVWAVACSKAGGVETFDPLSKPMTPVVCRSIPPIPGQPEEVVLHFLDGQQREYAREIRAAYHTSGQPTSILIMASEQKDSAKSVAHFIGVNFGPNGRSGRAILDGSTAKPLLVPDSSSRIDSSWPTGLVPLTDVERLRVDSLSKWLWDHRCPGVFHRHDTRSL